MNDTDPISPERWGRRLSAPPVLASEELGARACLVRRWRGTDPDMSQPVLDHHYVILHLGGPKMVERRSPLGPTERFAVEEGAISIAPAGSAFEWRTFGPIDFAHLYIAPARFNRVVAAVFDREPARVRLNACVGVRDRLLHHLILAALEEAAHPNPWRAAYFETLAEAATVHLVARHSTLPGVAEHARHALAPSRLRRVLERIEAGLEGPLTLAELAEAAGLSRFHFSRAFRTATGEAPLAFVGHRRIERAKALLRGGELPLAEVGRRCGFTSPARFSTTFRRLTGLSPSDYRKHL